MIATKRNMETGDNSHGSSGHFCAKRVPIADLARRRLVVVERQGQAHIIRFCAKVTPRVKPDPECVPPLTSAARTGPSATYSHLRSSCLSSIMPWLGAGGAAELGRRLGTRRRRHRILVAFPGVCAFRLTARFGANVSYSLAAIPLSPDESWQALHCALRAGPTC